MVPAGLPELTHETDIEYLREKLCLEMTDAHAERHFIQEIENSLDTMWRRVDDFFHDNKQ